MYCRFLIILAKTANELNENLIWFYNILCEFTRIFKFVDAFVDAVKLWNSLPHNIKNKPSIKLFKTAVKKYFISSYRNLDNFETILSNSTLSNFNFL